MNKVLWLVPPGLVLLLFGSYYGQKIALHGDNLLHLLRLIALHKNIMEGNFYPRWMPELFLGFGYPLLNFYAPATYYLAELLHLLGAGYPESIIGTMLVLALIAAFGIYRLALDIFTDANADPAMRPYAPALLTTVAYLFAPYLVFNIYVRGAIAEVGAQALLPWILWSFRRSIRSAQPGRYLFVALFSLGTLAFTHTVSLLLVPPLLVIYLLFLFWQQRRVPRQRARWAWVGLSIGAAISLSAFVWLPLIVERHYLWTYAYEMAAQSISHHAWTWQSWLNPNLTYDHITTNPPRLALVQILLSIIGLLLLVKRRNAELFFMAAVALVASFFISDLSVPIWQASSTMLVIQFPWRLLAIVNLSLALLAGNVVAYVVRTRVQALATVAIIGLIVYSCYPRMENLLRLQLDEAHINYTSISQYEAITTRYGLSAIGFREFMPRWVEEISLEALSLDDEVAPVDVTLFNANAHELEMEVSTSRPSTLRFSTLYFPGWQVTLQDGQHLSPYPSTRFGLLTVDIPAGSHQIQVAWRGTALHTWGTAISLSTLLLLALFSLLHSRLRTYSLLPISILAIVLAARFAAPNLAPHFQQSPPVEVASGIRLLGYYTHQEDNRLYIFPHWYIAAPPPDVQLHWQLTDDTDQLITETTTYPYFNTLRTYFWLQGMVADDAYYLPLPPGTDAGSYTVSVQAVPAGQVQTQHEETGATTTPVGKIDLAHDVAPLPPLAHPLDVTFVAPDGRNAIFLRGYETHIESASEHAPGNNATLPYSVVSPGDKFLYTLYWQARHSVPDGDQVFVQLLDHNRQVVTQTNQPLEFSQGAPYFLWDPYFRKGMSYRLEIPPNIRSGLYRAYVGMYELQTGTRFATSGPGANGEITSEGGLDLQTIKIYNPALSASPLSHTTSVKFGDHITLTGYDLTIPDDGLHAGSHFTLTLQYKNLGTNPTDYTQFVHLANSEQGMAAQHDTPPQSGTNPTSAWVVGEIVNETIPLTILENALPGRYTLRLGLYDPNAGGIRLPVWDEKGNPLPDNQVILTELEIKD